jgi:cytochrome P450
MLIIYCFHLGQFVCIGKAIALQEIRLFTTMVLKKFKFQFAKEHDHQAFLDAVESNNSLVKGSLLLKVENR